MKRLIILSIFVILNVGLSQNEKVISKMDKFVSNTGSIIKLENFYQPELKGYSEALKIQVRKATVGDETAYYLQMTKEDKYGNKTASIAEEKTFLREYTYKTSDYGYEQTRALPRNYEQNTPLFGKITLPLGHVFIQSIVDDNWEKARFNQDVFSNEKVKTESKSRCEVKLGVKKVLRIGEKTIVTLMHPGVNNATMQIESGQAWLTDFSKKRSTTSVRTPTAVAAIRGTVFRIDCDNNQSTINVYKGMVDVSPLKEDGITPEDTTFTVNACEKFVVVKNFEEYREQQEKALKEFQDKEESDFQAFLNRENQKFKKAVQSEQQAFEKFRSVHINKSKIDDKKDQSSDWVNWNKERDDILVK